MRSVRIASWSNVLPTTTHVLQAGPRCSERIRGFSKPFIPRGAGRSYGDAAYVTDGVTLTSSQLRGLGELDSDSGLITCQSGATVADIFARLESTPWAFPIGGGTQWTTVGGCVASDVHGKNDVAQGSFGNHVESLRLILPSGERVECSSRSNAPLFAATVGGMGLTGFTESVTLRLQQPPSTAVESRAEAVHSPEEMTEALRASDSEFSVAWLDLLHSDFRGIHYQADFVEATPKRTLPPIRLPLPRIRLFSRPVVRRLNAMRFARNSGKRTVVRVRDFHHPVDALKHWNKLYGPHGFHEYQFLVAEDKCTEAMEAFLAGCVKFELKPFFAVAKRFGHAQRQGLLSFPEPGITIMADFAQSPSNQPFFSYFTDYLLELNGKVYLAKDSYLTAPQFERMHPNLDEWRSIVQQYDPQNRVQSDLSRRLDMKPW